MITRVPVTDGMRETNEGGSAARGLINEPRCEKTGLRGFRPGPTQAGLYNYRRWLEA